MADEDYELGEQNFEIPSIQAHMCLYHDTGIYVPVSRLSNAGLITIQAHFFGVPGVCLYRVFTVLDFI